MWVEQSVPTYLEVCVHMDACARVWIFMYAMSVCFQHVDRVHHGGSPITALPARSHIHRQHGHLRCRLIPLPRACVRDACMETYFLGGVTHRSGLSWPCGANSASDLVHRCLYLRSYAKSRHRSPSPNRLPSYGLWPTADGPCGPRLFFLADGPYGAYGVAG